METIEALTQCVLLVHTIFFSSHFVFSGLGFYQIVRFKNLPFYYEVERQRQFLSWDILYLGQEHWVLGSGITVPIARLVEIIDHEFHSRLILDLMESKFYPTKVSWQLAIITLTNWRKNWTVEKVKIEKWADKTWFVLAWSQNMIYKTCLRIDAIEGTQNEKKLCLRPLSIKEYTK